MIDYELFHSPTLCYSPPFSMILRGYADLVDAGYGPAELYFTNSMPVVWVGTGRNILGASVYHVDAAKQIAHQVFIIVGREYRGKGLSDVLTKRVMWHAKEEGALRLFQSVHPSNTAWMKAHPEQSRVVSTKYELLL